MTKPKMTKEEVKEWIRETGYNHRIDYRNPEAVANDEEIPLEYWEYIAEIEAEEGLPATPPRFSVLSAPTPLIHFYGSGGYGGGGLPSYATGSNGQGDEVVASPPLIFCTGNPPEPEKKYTSWGRLIREEMRKVKDDWDNIEHSTLADEELRSPFLADATEPGKSFTFWTKERVYFPCWNTESGYSSVASVPRNPSSEAVKHIGADYWVEGKIE